MSEIHFDVNAGRERTTPVPLEETPCRIVLLGDFSGRDLRPDAPSGRGLAERRTWRVDRDDLDETIAELAPSLVLALDGGLRLELRIAALDDFHPDRLMERVPVLHALHDLRRRLGSPGTFADAARELAGGAPPSAAAPARAAGGSLLDEILDEVPPPTADEALADAHGDLAVFIQHVMRPHLVPNPDPRAEELKAQVDAAATATLRAMLHAPAFQALEGLWRTVDLLVRRVDTGTELQLHLLDVSSRELAEALPAGGDPARSALHQCLTRQSGSAPWTLVAGAYTFDASSAAIDRVAQLAAIGQLLGAPVVVGAEAALVGASDTAALADHRAWSPTPDPAWEALRSTQLARSVGLVLPRFLVREPYGKGFVPCESVNFEELGGHASPAECLWGPSSFLVALIIARAFGEAGWRLGSALDPDIGGLPLVVTGPSTDRRTMPVGEVLLSEAAADRVMARGIMPLATMKDTDQVRLVRLQSVAHPLAALAGRWSST